MRPPASATPGGTLHLVSNPAALDSCLAALGARDAVLLLGDGVFALPRLAADAPQRCAVHAEDAAARGVSAGAAETLGEADFVAWVVRYARSVTWT